MLTSCDILRDEVQQDELDITYNYVFGSIDQQIRAVKLFKRLIRKRDIYMKVMKRI